MVARALAAEGSPTTVLRPVFFEREGEDYGSPSFRRSSSAAARSLAAGPEGRDAGLSARAPRTRGSAMPTRPRSPRSWRWESGLRDIGRRCLAWAREHDYPVVLIAGETHVVHDAVLDAGIHELVAANGALPLPADCYPVPDGGARGCAASTGPAPGQTLRAAIAGARDGDVFPLLLGAYGCGPNSMIEHLFTRSRRRLARTPCSRATGTAARPAT